MTINTKALINLYTVDVVDIADVADVAAGVTLLPLGFASQNPSRCSRCSKGTINYEMKHYKNDNSHQSLNKPLCGGCSSRGNVVTPRFCFAKS